MRNYRRSPLGAGRAVALWAILAVVSLIIHVGIELLIRGDIAWQLVLGSVLTLPTLIVVTTLFGHSRSAPEGQR